MLLQLDEVNQLTGSVYLVLAAGEFPVGRDSKELVFYAAGNPALLNLIQQPNGALRRNMSDAVSQDGWGLAGLSVSPMLQLVDSKLVLYRLICCSVCRAKRLLGDALDHKKTVTELRKLARPILREEINVDNNNVGELWHTAAVPLQTRACCNKLPYLW